MRGIGHVLARAAVRRPLFAAVIATLLLMPAWAVAMPQPVAQAAVSPMVVTAANDYSCALSSEGTIGCWGNNDVGQTVVPAGTYQALSSTGRHACAIKLDGTLACWGYNYSCQSCAQPGTFIAVATGLEHTCTLRPDGTALCWGWDYFGQADAPAGSFRRISAAQYHSCAIASTTGYVICWGLNSYGEASSNGSTAFTEVATGLYHTCAIAVAGNVICWGDNGAGESTSPGGTFKAIATGVAFTCGIRTSGDIACWGWNSAGQVSGAPGPWSAYHNFVAIAAGGEHACAMTAQGLIVCWGGNAAGKATPPAFPYYPSDVVVTAGDAAATVSWSPVTADPIPTGYTVTSSPDGRTCRTITTSCTVTGLTNGTTYTFTVTSWNGPQPSWGVAYSDMVTIGTPGRPGNVTATRGDGYALINWSPAAANGGPVTQYTVTSSPDGLTCTTSSTACLVTGLTNGVAYTFTVVATNAIGAGAPSDATEPVTPVGAPGRPTAVAATAHNGAADVAWTAPSDGGSAITGYTVTAYPGPASCSTTGETSCTVPGLTNGTSYTFTVTATNALGTSAVSGPSAPVTPATAPDKPTDVGASAGANLAIVTWSPPASNGSAITAYTVTASPGGKTCATTGATFCVVTGLDNYLAYSFTVTATNAAGTSDPSDPSPAVTPRAAAVRFEVTAAPSVTAGAELTVTVTAIDGDGATATGYRGTVFFSSSDPSGVVPRGYAFTASDAGSHTFTITLKTAGVQSIGVADSSDAGVAGSVDGVLVLPASVASFVVTAPTAWIAGESHDLTVAARDTFGNTASAYTGTVHVSSTDAAAVLPSDYAFTAEDAGVHVFHVALRTATTRGATGTITATDAANASVTGSQVGIAVAPGTTVSFLVWTATTWSAGGGHTVYVIAKDGSGNTVTNYTGTVHVTSTDPAAVLPGDYTYAPADQGNHRFVVYLKTAGTRSITATDTAAASVTGSQTGIAVRPGVVRSFLVTTATSWVAGAGHSLYVTAKDSCGNTVTGYTGTIHFASSDAQAALPADYTFTAADHGQRTFVITLRTAGTRSVTVTDYAGTAGSQAGINVTAGSAKSFTVTAPAAWARGSAQVVTVTARDAWGNVATGYRGQIRFATSDPAAVKPGNYTFVAGDAGVHSFTVTLNTAGIQSITATDVSSPTITGTSSGITVS